MQSRRLASGTGCWRARNIRHSVPNARTLRRIGALPKPPAATPSPVSLPPPAAIGRTCAVRLLHAAPAFALRQHKLGADRHRAAGAPACRRSERICKRRCRNHNPEAGCWAPRSTDSAFRKPSWRHCMGWPLFELQPHERPAADHAKPKQAAPLCHASRVRRKQTRRAEVVRRPLAYLQYSAFLASFCHFIKHKTSLALRRGYIPIKKPGLGSNECPRRATLMAPARHPD